MFSKNSRRHQERQEPIEFPAAEQLVPEDKPTSAEEWKQGVLVYFPSGMKARCRPVSWEMLAENKDIPEELLSIVADHIAGKTKDVRVPTQSLEDRLTYRRFLRNLARRMFIEPVVSDTPKEGQLTSGDIEDDDLYYLGMLIGGGTQVLRTFRPEQAADLLLMVAKQFAQADAQRDTANSRTGGNTDAGAGDVVDDLPV